jgi:Zn-dependent alcohol dehydrogenase
MGWLSHALKPGNSSRRPTMKAIVLNEYGDYRHLQLAEIPEPKPVAGEIKVKVAAAGLISARSC